jgi:hypothetical protein
MANTGSLGGGRRLARKRASSDPTGKYCIQGRTERLAHLVFPFEGRGSPLADVGEKSARSINRSIPTHQQVSEIDVDMSRFSNGGHLALWARICPGPLRQSVSDQAPERAQAITGSEPRRASPRTAAIRTAALTSVAKNMRQERL